MNYSVHLFWRKALSYVSRRCPKNLKLLCYARKSWPISHAPAAAGWPLLTSCIRRFGCREPMVVINGSKPQLSSFHKMPRRKPSPFILWTKPSLFIGSGWLWDAKRGVQSPKLREGVQSPSMAATSFSYLWWQLQVDRCGGTESFSCDLYCTETLICVLVKSLLVGSQLCAFFYLVKFKAVQLEVWLSLWCVTDLKLVFITHAESSKQRLCVEDFKI